MQEKYRKPQINTVGLVARYKLWAGLTSPGKVFDYSLGGFEGTITGAGVIPAYPGFSFDNLTDFISVGTGPSSVSTVLQWMNPADIAGTDFPISLSATDFLSIATGTLTKSGFAGGTTVLYVDGITGTGVTANWHLIGITDTVAKNASLLRIGFVQPGPPLSYEGLIGETFLFDRVLSPADVKSIYEITKWRYQ